MFHALHGIQAAPWTQRGQLLLLQMQRCLQSCAAVATALCCSLSQALLSLTIYTTPGVSQRDRAHIHSMLQQFLQDQAHSGKPCM